MAKLELFQMTFFFFKFELPLTCTKNGIQLVLDQTIDNTFKYEKKNQHMSLSD